MKISVIIPAFNEERGLAKALDAVLKQNHDDYEIIVVDNASVDRTSEIARSFGVKVLRENRKGTMWACESGRLAADGDIIVRMDADCLPEPHWLSSGTRHFDDPTVVLVSGPYDYHNAKPFFRKFSLMTQRILYPTVNHILQFFNLGALSIGGNTFIRRETLDKMGGFNTSLTFYGDDTDTAKRASKHGRVIFNRRLVVKTSAPTALRYGGQKKVIKYWIHFFKVIFSSN